LFTSEFCGACPTVKKYLNLKGVDFTELNGMEKDNMEEILRISGRMIFPTLKVTNGEDTKVVSGANIAAIASALDF
jgi:glutaredoxin